MQTYGDLLLAGAACAGGRVAARSLWVQAVGGGLSGLVLYKSTPLPYLPFYLVFLVFIIFLFLGLMLCDLMALIPITHIHES